MSQCREACSLSIRAARPPCRLTYFAALDLDAAAHPVAQQEVEARHLQRSNIRSRQATRFGVHGFHEYKGKFNPQLARALTNAVDPDAVVLGDPFAGSGTALIEALRLGLDAHGRDRSPIAVFLSTAQWKAHQTSDPQRLAAALPVGRAGRRGAQARSGRRKQRLRASVGCDHTPLPVGVVHPACVRRAS